MEIEGPLQELQRYLQEYPPNKNPHPSGFVTLPSTLTPKEIEEAKSILKQFGARDLKFGVLSHPGTKGTYSVLRWSNPIKT